MSRTAEWTPGQRAEMLALLERYGRHIGDCPLAWRYAHEAAPRDDRRCSCSLDAARAELARGG